MNCKESSKYLLDSAPFLYTDINSFMHYLFILGLLHENLSATSTSCLSAIHSLQSLNCDTANSVWVEPHPDFSCVDYKCNFGLCLDIKATSITCIRKTEESSYDNLVSCYDYLSFEYCFFYCLLFIFFS